MVTTLVTFAFIFSLTFAASLTFSPSHFFWIIFPNKVVVAYEF